MSRFEFPLENVLRLRRLLEDQQYMALQQANQKVARSQQSIAEAMQQLRSSQSAWLGAVSSGATGAELQYARQCEENFRAAIEQAREEHRKLVAESIVAREEYIKLRRDSEVVQHLRDNSYARWRTEESRREQQQADELHLMRRRKTTPLLAAKLASRGKSERNVTGVD